MTTPDTEGEKEELVRKAERDIEFVVSNPDMYDISVQVKNIVRNLLSSRDTYWKERVLTWVKENSKELSDPYPFDSKYTYSDFVSASELEDFITNEDNLK